MQPGGIRSTRQGGADVASHARRGAARASVAAPFGPVSLACLHRSLADGPRAGIANGLGAGTAHGTFAAIAVLGATVIASTISDWRQPIGLSSAVVLIVLGVRLLLRRAKAASPQRHVDLTAAYGSGLLLAMSNPMTILPYFAVSSALADAGGRPVDQVISTSLGAMLGATSWYTAISSLASMLRGPLARIVLPRLHLAAGAALIVFGTIIGIGSL